MSDYEFDGEAYDRWLESEWNKQWEAKKKFELPIIDYCLDCIEPDCTGAISLCDAFKEIHDDFRMTYKQIHKKFIEELKQRKDVYTTRTSDIFVRGVERRRMPIIEGQWHSHLYRR